MFDDAFCVDSVVLPEQPCLFVPFGHSVLAFVA